VSISSTFFARIFCTNVILAAFSSYVLALANNSYKKRAQNVDEIDGRRVWTVLLTRIILILDGRLTWESLNYLKQQRSVWQELEFKWTKLEPWHKKRIFNTIGFFFKFPPNAHVIHNIFAHNIAIKRYCDIWHFLSTDFYWTTKVSSYKNLVNELMYLVLCFDQSSPWPIDIHGPKIYFITIFFIAILCAKMSRVNKA